MPVPRSDDADDLSRVSWDALILRLADADPDALRHLRALAERALARARAAAA